MEEMNLILKIQSVYNQFTKAEKKVADYCLAHKEEVPYLSITELADACEVGDTSVYRFCRTLKLDGYQEFKMRFS
ncbi:MAG: MurR/RpiR family transcriptional regulator, partial [Acetatifactor sp.]